MTSPFEAKWDVSASAADDVEFDHSYANGQVDLMQRLQLHQSSPDQAKVVARDFNAQVMGPRAAGASSSFVAFHSGEAVDAVGDAVLTPAWRVGKAMDVDEPDKAVGELLQIMR